MRVLVSLGAFVLVFLVGVKTEWISVSQAARVTSEERAVEAVVFGETRPDATSGELIDAAAVRGEISSEQALLYGVYLVCGDPRLPARFYGQDVEPPAKNILWEADVDWTSLSSDIRQALAELFTAGAAGETRLTCGDEVARFKDDASVWWAPALHTPSQPTSAARPVASQP